MSSDLMPGWYVLTYHNVSWEEGPLLRSLGGTCPPDVFRDHVRTCAAMGRLVSVRDGIERLRSGAFDEPQFSFWFDDGLSGVSRHAAPILAEFGVTGAQSVCSRFAARTEMFWRFKLSYLHGAGAHLALRESLRGLGLRDDELLRHFTIDRFGDGVMAALDRGYAEVVGAADQELAFDIFDTPDALLELHRAGWVLANHSAAHYPIGQAGVEDILLDQFLECEGFIEQLTGRPSDFWVLPFDRRVELSALEPARAPDRRSMVLMRNRVNTPGGGEDADLIYRIHSPENDRSQLPELLRQASRNSQP